MPGRLRPREVKAISLHDNAALKRVLAVTTVDVTVSASGTSGASAANDALIGGEILGWYPSAQDQIVKSIVLGADGSVTVTLGTAATADNVIHVQVVAAK